MNNKGNDEVSSDSKEKKSLTESQKKRIFEKYTTHFEDFLNGKYANKDCDCEDEDCCCANLESA